MLRRLNFKDDWLLRDNQVRNMRKASRRLHKSVFNYIFNEKPVTAHDERFIYHRDDFVFSTNHIEFNWLDDIMHKFMDHEASSFLRVSSVHHLAFLPYRCWNATLSFSFFPSTLTSFIFAFVDTTSSVFVYRKKTATAPLIRISITTLAAAWGPSSVPWLRSCLRSFYWRLSMSSLQFRWTCAWWPPLC